MIANEVYEKMLHSIDVAALILPDGEFQPAIIRKFENDSEDAEALLKQPFEKETSFEEIETWLRGTASK